MLTTILVALALQAAPPADCLRMAFGSYCLGGLAASLPPKPVYTSEDGTNMAWGTPGGSTHVALFSGRVMMVSRMYKPESWITFNDLAAELRGTFGEPQDASDFPDFADDRDSRANTISLGSGRALLIWHPTADYKVSLMWSQNALVINYVAADLYRQSEAAAKPKF